MTGISASFLLCGETGHGEREIVVLVADADCRTIPALVTARLDRPPSVGTIIAYGDHPIELLEVSPADPYLWRGRVARQ